MDGWMDGRGKGSCGTLRESSLRCEKAPFGVGESRYAMEREQWARV